MLRGLCLGLALLVAGCASQQKRSSLQRFEFEEPQMGVPFRIVLYATDDSTAERAADAAFARVAELNQIMSDYETDSEISHLSRSSEQGSPPVAVSEDLWRVLRSAQTLADQSDGAFDITIGPCSALWRKARRDHEFPPGNRLSAARAKVGYQNLLLDEPSRTARLLKFGMRLDLGAIAKGYAADQALLTLRALGIRSALVAASGDLALGDAPPGTGGWKVEITGYDAPGGPAAQVIELSNQAVATSGDLFQRLEIGGFRYSHILDPRTCIGTTNQAMATVIAKDCMTADMLATTCTLLSDPGEVVRLAEKYRVAVRVIRLEKETPVVNQNRRFRNLLR